MSIIAKAHFEYEAETYEMEENIVKTNTVAIMFPFIRSQVTLLTTQPGMTPIVLPPIQQNLSNINSKRRMARVSHPFVTI